MPEPTCNRTDPHPAHRDRRNDEPWRECPGVDPPEPAWADDEAGLRQQLADAIERGDHWRGLAEQARAEISVWRHRWQVAADRHAEADLRVPLATHPALDWLAAHLRQLADDGDPQEEFRAALSGWLAVRQATGLDVPDESTVETPEVDVAMHQLSRQVWAAAVRWSAGRVGLDDAVVLIGLAGQIEAGELSPWAEDQPAPEPPVPPVGVTAEQAVAGADDLASRLREGLAVDLTGLPERLTEAFRAVGDDLARLAGLSQAVEPPADPDPHPDEGPAVPEPADGRLDVDAIEARANAASPGPWAAADAAVADAAKRAPLPPDGIDPSTIPDQQARGWPDFHPEAFCHRCGRPNLRGWSTDSALWNLAEGGEGGILCPVCFGADYERVAGQRMTWRLAPEPAPVTDGLILGRALLDRDGDLWSEGDRGHAESYPPVREVLLVDPAAGPILDAVRAYFGARDVTGDATPESMRAYAALAAAVDAAGNQPATDPETAAEWDQAAAAGLPVRVVGGPPPTTGTPDADPEPADEGGPGWDRCNIQHLIATIRAGARTEAGTCDVAVQDVGELEALLADRDRLATGQAAGAVVAAWAELLDAAGAELQTSRARVEELEKDLRGRDHTIRRFLDQLGQAIRDRDTARNDLTQLQAAARRLAAHLPEAPHE